VLNDHFAILTLHASAGAYIKEFIHGDFGRTNPSFSDVVFGMQVKCDILQLDVLEVKQDDEEEGYVPLWERN
jgi:tRNA pseudouridine synthase 10